MHNESNEVPLTLEITDDGMARDVAKALPSLAEFGGKVLWSEDDGTCHRLSFVNETGKRLWMLILCRVMANGMTSRGWLNATPEKLAELMRIPITT